MTRAKMSQRALARQSALISIKRSIRHQACGAISRWTLSKTVTTSPTNQKLKSRTKWLSQTLLQRKLRGSSKMRLHQPISLQQKPQLIRLHQLTLKMIHQLLQENLLPREVITPPMPTLILHQVALVSQLLQQAAVEEEARNISKSPCTICVPTEHSPKPRTVTTSSSITKMQESAQIWLLESVKKMLEPLVDSPSTLLILWRGKRRLKLLIEE